MAETALQVVPSRQTLEPTTLQEAIQFSGIIAKSDLAPKDYRGKADNILVAIQFGKELGIPPMQALQGIAVINGRPSVWGDLMWALVTSHPQFEDAIEEVTETQAKVTLKRKGRSPVTVTFTKGDAEKAKLWNKEGPWQTYPKRQLLWRARTFAARDLFPDALKGMVSAEEAMDYPEGPTIDAQPAQQQTQAAIVEEKAQPEETIGVEGGTAFYKAYKAHGWTPDEAKAFLKEKFQIEEPRNSKDIPKSKFEEVMKWAETKAPIRIEVEAAMDALGWSEAEKQQALADPGKLDWKATREHLSRKIEERDARERF